MATTEYILTDANVGFVFRERDGFILSLVRSVAPHLSCYQMDWEDRYFVLRDSASPRNLFCIDGVNYGLVPLWIGGAQFWIINSCLRFFGDLALVCIPAGSEWELTLSDVYVAPRPPLHPMVSWGFAPNGMWGHPSGGQRYQRHLRYQRQLQLAAPHLQISGPSVAVEIEREV